MSVKYDQHYRASDAACGDPFKEFVAFAQAHGGPGVQVLDLGCGQGRDALLFARAGCSVLGLDVSSVGVGQMRDAAQREGLDVRGVVGDLLSFEPTAEYDVVILDRVLHMLDSDALRVSVLTKAADATREGGFVLVADGPKHRELIRGGFVRRGWALVKATKNRTFARRPLSE